MKQITLLSLLLSLFFVVRLHAQPTKVEKTIDNIEKGRNTIEKLRTLLPGKKNKADSSTPSPENTSLPNSQNGKVGTTIVNINGIEFSMLKSFTENIKACAGVQSAVMKYNSTTSSIEVQHIGTTEALLKLMEETSKVIFTEKNLESFEEGKIQLKLNPKG